MRTLLLVSALFALFGSSAAVPAPFAVPVPIVHHAFCKTLWLFATPCAEISKAVKQQIQAFNPLNGCDDCQYTLVAYGSHVLKANHTSLDGLQSESIIFTFTPTTMSGGCRMFAQSTSVAFTSLLDDGLNYCNIYKLLSASGLTSSPGVMEETNEWACLGFELATCKSQ